MHDIMFRRTFLTVGSTVTLFFFLWIQMPAMILAQTEETGAFDPNLNNNDPLQQQGQSIPVFVYNPSADLENGYRLDRDA